MKEFNIRILDSEFCDLSCKLLNSSTHSYSYAEEGSSYVTEYNVKRTYYCGLCVSEDRSLSWYLEHDNNTDNIHRCERCKQIFRV